MRGTRVKALRRALRAKHPGLPWEQKRQNAKTGQIVDTGFIGVFRRAKKIYGQLRRREVTA